MFFGILLLLLFVIVNIVLLLIWVFTKNSRFIVAIPIVWASVAMFILLLNLVNYIEKPERVSVSDIAGEYIIDRTKCAGRQADWQYDHYRFEITKSNEILFHITDHEKITKTYHGKVSFEGEVNPLMEIHPDSPTYHIIDLNPIMHRRAFSFYYVFRSPLYKNVFFKKGHWKKVKE